MRRRWRRFAAVVCLALGAAALAVACGGCAASSAVAANMAARTMPPIPDAERGEQLRPGLWVKPIADGVWMWIGQNDPDDEQPVDANGLVVRVNEYFVLVDTGWNAGQADALMEWFDRMEAGPVRAAIVTHSHVDRSGGVRRLLERGVRVAMLDSTAAKLGLNEPGAVNTFANMDTLPVSGRVIEMFWPGAGHTTDNITVWIPDQHVLFGGCFLKATDWKVLGNLADADLKAWPHSLDRLERRYRDAMIVVPGHGRVGGSDVIAHTKSLVNAKRR